MKLRTTPPPEDCYVYTTPFNTESQQHWEFVIATRDYPSWITPSMPYINLKIIAHRCDGDSFVYFDDVPGNLLLLKNTRHLFEFAGPDIWVLFKNFNYVYEGKQYLEFMFCFDNNMCWSVYSHWLEFEPCTGEVATILPCIQEGVTTDINGDFVGELPTMTASLFNSIINQYYSPQMYLRNARMIQDKNTYEYKKINNKVLRATLQKIWTLDSENVQENCFVMLHSVFGFAKVWFEGEIFVLETFGTEMIDVKALHIYHKINFSSQIEVKRAFLCTSRCIIAEIE